MRCGLRWMYIAAWLRDYDNLLRLSVKLIYIQIGCALIGSLGPLYNGVLLLNLGNSLFGLVAIESSSQILVRTHAFILSCSILIDISWFLLFSRDIWFFPSDFYGTFVKYPVKLILAMQVLGLSVKLSSSLLWLQMYRLGPSYLEISRSTDADLRNSLLNPATHSAQNLSGVDIAPASRSYQSFFAPVIENSGDGSDPSLGGEIQEDSPEDSLASAHAQLPLRQQSASF